MHPNPILRNTEAATALTFARERGFGTLCVNGPTGPLLAHIPFLLSDDGAAADLHLVRSNPIARVPAGPAVLVAQGSDGYVSPDWYGIPDQVPTWNYISVQLRGRLEQRPDSDLRDLIDRQSAHFEEQLLPKVPWTSAKMTPDVHRRMMRQILPFRFLVEEMHSTFKLNQNKPDAARQAAATQMAKSDIGLAPKKLARHMAALPPTEP